MKQLITPLILLFSISLLNADNLQNQLLDQLDDGLNFMDSPASSCQVLLESQFHMANPNGRKPMDHYELYLLTGQPGSEWDYEMLESQTQGEENAPPEDESDQEEEDEESVMMVIPSQEYREHFSYNLNLDESRLYFEPLESYADEQGYSSGFLQFDEVSGTLQHIKADCLVPPRRVDWMDYQMSFQRWDGNTVPQEMLVQGEGGFLMIRKVFETRLTWSEYQRLD